MADFALIAEDDGTRLTVEQLGQIEFEGLDRGIALYYQGQPAIRIQVERGPDGDAIALQESVERAVAIFNEQSADGVSAVLSRPRAQAIKDRLGILIENGITGLVIVITMLFLFLSVRTAFWVTIGIPTAMLATVALMLALGLSLNMVSLFALIICLGIVVDDAIVIGEHADHLHRQGHARRCRLIGGKADVSAGSFIEPNHHYCLQRNAVNRRTFWQPDHRHSRNRCTGHCGQFDRGIPPAPGPHVPRTARRETGPAGVV